MQAGAGAEGSAPATADAPRPGAAQGAAAAPATTGGQTAQQEGSSQPGTPQAPALAAAAGGAPATPATAPAQVTPVQASTPAAPATPVAAQAAQLPSPVLLADRLEKVHALVQLAQSGGTATARLELHPLDLGRVDVLLRAGADGVIATVAAQERTTLEALQQAGQDLRRSLEDRGVTVARLDLQLGAHADERREPGAAGDGAPQRTARPGAAASADGTTTDSDTVPTTTTIAGMPAGSLVDVHA